MEIGKENTGKWREIQYLLTIFTVVIALFSNETEGEAGIGSFDSQSMNENWLLERNGESVYISLPKSVNTDKDEILSIKNTLPSDLSDSCSLLTRASMADLYIYVNCFLQNLPCRNFLHVSVW